MNDDSTIILEGQTVIQHDLILTEEDRKFAEALAREEIVVIDELRQGVRISAKWSWVGVLQFTKFELQIHPKLSSREDYKADNFTTLAEMLDFISDEQDLKIFRKRLRSFDGKGRNLFELLIGAFVDAVEEIVSRGVLTDYVSTRETLPVLRGRLLMSEQITKHFGRFDRLECEFDEHTGDIRENKLLLAALSVCAQRVQNQALSVQLERLIAVFEDITNCDSFDFDQAYLEQVESYDRLNFYYRRAHSLAGLIMAGLSHRTIFEGGEQKCFSFLFKMYEVFEKFVHKMLTIELLKLDYKIYYQKGDSEILWNAKTDRSYASLRPDFVIENSRRRGVFLPVDAKYKNFDERSVFRGEKSDELATKISTPDIYQTFAYAHGFGHGQHSILPTSIMFYPTSVEDSSIKRIHVRRRLDHTASGAIIVVPLNIKRSLAAIKSGKSDANLSEALTAISSVLTV